MSSDKRILLCLSIRGRGCHQHGCPGPKYANACGSRRRMTPLSRSDPVLRFVRHAKDLLAGAMQVASTERNDPTPVVSGGSKEWAVCPRLNDELRAVAL